MKKEKEPETQATNINESALDQGFNDRIRALINMFDTNREAADTAKISESQIKKYKYGDSRPAFKPIARLAEYQKISLDWVWTGHAKNARDTETQQLEQFEAYLNTIDLPLSQDQIAADPELQKIQRALQQFSSPRANLMKELIFKDHGAARRRQAQLKDTIETYKQSLKEWDNAVVAAGYIPPDIVTEHIKTIMFRYQIPAEEIIPLLAALNSSKSTGKE